jgi:hypothetical protein
LPAHKCLDFSVRFVQAFEKIVKYNREQGLREAKKKEKQEQQAKKAEERKTINRFVNVLLPLVLVIHSHTLGPLP